MKKLLILIICLLWITPCHAWMSSVICGGGPAAPSYLVSESFDAATLCATGLTSNCTNTWTKAGTGTATFNDTDPTLEGTNSLYLDGSAKSISVYVSVAAQTAVYGYAQIYMANLPGVSFRVLSFADSSGSNKGYVTINTNGRISINNGLSSGITANTAGGKIAGGTLYHVWWGYTKGTGTDGTYYVAFSSDGTKPTSGDAYASGTNGNANSDIERVYMTVGATGENNIINIDKLRVNTTDIGSNPS